MTLIDVLFISLKSFIFHYSHCRVSHASRWSHFWSTNNRVVWLPATVIQGRFFIFSRWQFMKTQLQLILQKSSILMNMQWSYLLPSELWHSSHEIVTRRKWEESILSYLNKHLWLIMMWKTHFTIIRCLHKHYYLGIIYIRKRKIAVRFFKMTFLSMVKFCNYIWIQSYQILVVDSICGPPNYLILLCFINCRLGRI